VILTDTSVVIDYARGKDAKLAGLISQRPVAVCGIVRAELLCGARDPAHRSNLLTLLATFAQISISEPIWDVAGDHLAALRRRGITVPFPDVVIATLGIVNDIEVWARDPHFPAMQTALGAAQAVPGAALRPAVKLASWGRFATCQADAAGGPEMVSVPGAAPRGTKAKKRFQLPDTTPVVSCYEAGRDGLWLHRCLSQKGLVIVDSASI
jgi:predicted nucleic acid-binding protein